LGKSDHAVLLVSLQESVDIRVQERLNYGKGDYKSLKESLNLNWDSLLLPYKDNVDQMWEVFKKRVITGINRFIPKVKDFRQGKKKHWNQPLDEKTRQLIKEKSRLWARYIETRRDDIIQKYKIVRNKLRWETRQIAKMECDKIAAECKSNPKKFWNYVNSRVKSSHDIGDIIIKTKNGAEETLKEDEDKANAFGDYFASIFSNEGNHEFNNLPYRGCNDNNNVVIDLKDIEKRMSNINIAKSAGCDGIHPRVLKELSSVLAYPLKLIFEHSFRNKELPIDWLSADITVIFKKGKKTEAGNYRPVSLTCICCKLMESIIRDHIMDYFYNNKLLSNKQFGFIKGRSTVTQLLIVLDKWTEYLEMGGQIDVIYTDFEKAFDKVPHKRLISKLYSYGINKDIIKWIEAFLINRRQRVKINGKLSKWLLVTSGIPQGSILGPLLFIIFINDIIEGCNNGSEIFLYADDAKLFRHIINSSDCKLLQDDINNISQWSDKWMLKLNAAKCKVVSYGRTVSHVNQYYVVSNQSHNILQRIEFISDLGVIFDEKLKFDKHIYEKINKAYDYFHACGGS
jgi:hypothetical protein